MALLELQITGNRLSLSGHLGTRDLRRVLSEMHKLTTGRGYQDIELDFTGCTAAYGGPILAIAAQAKRYLIGGLDVDLSHAANSAPAAPMSPPARFSCVAIAQPSHLGKFIGNFNSVRPGTHNLSPVLALWARPRTSTIVENKMMAKTVPWPERLRLIDT